MYIKIDLNDVQVVDDKYYQIIPEITEIKKEKFLGIGILDTDILIATNKKITSIKSEFI